MSDQATLKEFIQRVEAYQIDDPEKSLSFSDRLARENNWTVSYANRVVLEYKRFCILAMQAGHPVTPSEHVDQAWHLHLTYTRSYWKGFCEGVLGQPLHHEPTAGGKAEGEKFRDWYGATLESYRRVFTTEPPADIWPSINERFSHAGSWKWVNVGRNWVIPKRPVLIATSLAGSLGALILIAGCRPANLGMSIPTVFTGAVPPFNLNGIEFLVFYIVVALVTLLVIGILGRRADLDIDSAQPDAKSQSLNAYKAAVLAGGGSRLIQCVLTELTLQGCIQFEKQTWGRPPKMSATDRHPSSGAVADAVYNEIKSSSTPKLAVAIRPYYDKYVAELTSMNLRYPGRLKSLLGMLIAGAVLLLGLARILQGFATQHPIGLLFAEIVLFTIASAVVLFRSKMVTQSGKRLLEQFNQEHSPRIAAQAGTPFQIAQPADGVRAGAGSNELLWAVALTGVVGLAAVPELEMLRLSLDRYKNAAPGGADGGGCGAGCGAGGGGGGCGGGGCGGCGGCGG